MNETIYIPISFAGKRNHPMLPGIGRYITALLDAIELASKSKQKHISLNLLCGLADGADMICAEIFLSFSFKDGNKASLTGVFPFELSEYLNTIEDKPRFNKLLELCEKKIFLNGRYLPPDKDKEKDALARSYRAAAYRQQSDYLLSAANILLAVADENDPGRAGGTIETVSTALQANMPVLLLSLNNLHFYYLQNINQLEDLLAGNNTDSQYPIEQIANLLIEA